MKKKAFRLISWDRNSEKVNHKRFVSPGFGEESNLMGKGSLDSLTPTKF